MKKKIIYIIVLLMLFMPMFDVIAETYNNYDKDGIVSCGSNLVSGIPVLIPKVVKIGYTIIQVAVPVLLVVMGSLDLIKGLYAQKEDEIKKGQQTFIKRAIAAVIVFFVIQVVQIIVRFVSGNDQNIASCFNCFINGKAEIGACETTVVE